MSLYSGLGAPSAHSDLLSATPDNDESKRALLEEVKRRGRATVGSKSYPDAEAIYGKGIDILSSMLAENEDDSSKVDLAVLFSNRSLVRLQMGKVVEALEDADDAVKNDSSYVKAHWRRGQALTASGNNSEALLAFQKALEIEPANKALIKEVQLAKERKDQTDKLMTEKSSETGGSADEVRDVDMKDVSKQKSKSSNHSESKSKSHSSSESVEINDSTKNDILRGYKIRSDGKKTSYFDREISEETKQLIGDIAPKKIDSNGSGNESAVRSITTPEGASAWNVAGTWEERDVTPWAKETLEAALLSAEYILPDGSPSPGAHGIVSKVTKFGGHASFATVRGKKRYIYEFGITVNWVLTLGEDHSKVCRGTMTFPDIDGSVELGDGYDITDFNVEGSSPAGTGPIIDRFVKDGGLRDSIHKIIDDWVHLFRATY